MSQSRPTQPNCDSTSKQDGAGKTTKTPDSTPLTAKQRKKIVTKIKELVEPITLEGSDPLPWSEEIPAFILKHFPSQKNRAKVTFQDLLEAKEDEVDAELRDYQKTKLTIDPELFKPLEEALERFPNPYPTTGKSSKTKVASQQQNSQALNAEMLKLLDNKIKTIQKQRTITFKFNNIEIDKITISDNSIQTLVQNPCIKIKDNKLLYLPEHPDSKGAVFKADLSLFSAFLDRNIDFSFNVKLDGYTENLPQARFTQIAKKFGATVKDISKEIKDTDLFNTLNKFFGFENHEYQIAFRKNQKGIHTILHTSCLDKIKELQNANIDFYLIDQNYDAYTYAFWFNYDDVVRLFVTPEKYPSLTGIQKKSAVNGQPEPKPEVPASASESKIKPEDRKEETLTCEMNALETDPTVVNESKSESAEPQIDEPDEPAADEASEQVEEEQSADEDTDTDEQPTEEHGVKNQFADKQPKSNIDAKDNSSNNQPSIPTRDIATLQKDAVRLIQKIYSSEDFERQTNLIFSLSHEALEKRVKELEQWHKVYTASKKQQDIPEEDVEKTKSNYLPVGLDESESKSDQNKKLVPEKNSPSLSDDDKEQKKNKTKIRNPLVGKSHKDKVALRKAKRARKQAARTQIMVSDKKKEAEETKATVQEILKAATAKVLNPTLNSAVDDTEPGWNSEVSKPQKLKLKSGKEIELPKYNYEQMIPLRKQSSPPTQAAKSNKKIKRKLKKKPVQKMSLDEFHVSAKINNPPSEQEPGSVPKSESEQPQAPNKFAHKKQKRKSRQKQNAYADQQEGQPSSFANGAGNLRESKQRSGAQDNQVSANTTAKVMFKLDVLAGSQPQPKAPANGESHPKTQLKPSQKQASDNSTIGFMYPIDYLMEGQPSIPPLSKSQPQTTSATMFDIPVLGKPSTGKSSQIGQFSPKNIEIVNSDSQPGAPLEELDKQARK